MWRTRLAGVLATAALGATLVGCSGQSGVPGLTGAAGQASLTAAGDTAVIVSMRDDYFDPAIDTVKVNGTVTWRNDGTLTHTTTADDGSWNAALVPGQTFTHRFTQTGTFSYRCTIHQQVGQIVVIP